MYDDREELSLDELLPPAQVTRAMILLTNLCGAEIVLLRHPEAQATPVEFSLEPVAWLKSDLPIPQRRAAAALLELLLFHAAKYRLAANLHLTATEANYQELQQQHAALQASEARYRLLSESLQERVDSQVRTIRESQQKLYESARLRAVGQLAAGMAHEINTPIGFISSNLRTAQEYLGEITESAEAESNLGELIEDFHSLLEESLDGANRISGLIRDIRLFANIDQTDHRHFDLNALIETTLRLLQPDLATPDTVTLRLDRLPRIPGYPAKIGQAIHNALTNALRSLGDEGKVVVTTRPVDDMIELTVQDNGHGMSQEVRERAFEPFYTTREVGMGSGLGLPVILDVVTAHHGRLNLTSEVGQGTCLTLWLPIAGQAS
ncbi:HAMP domain-containing histidine kinase [Billgrantia pellis]|uniref:histidine kinase n=1 Tax=Billgrantia pellis TaxID=2606936 RepID=A0A7V7KF64_9GAMM|nr:HAMP domain-containing sensor histidine kinase [Halomonas pellis]KAA0010011.1 HAMP domain-containing histidine kinase [Halomonas pellis]